MRCKALLLDLDGVLADTEPIHKHAWDMVLAEMGLHASPSDWQGLMGTPAPEIARFVVETWAPEASAEILLEKKRLIFRGLLPPALKPFPGLAAELDKWNGVPIAVVTSGARAEALFMLAIMKMRDSFGVVVAYEDVPNTKPAPDCYLRAAGLLGVPTADCAAVEDSIRGLAAAIAAGTMAIAVPPVATLPLPAGAAGAFPSTVEALRWVRE
jgi:HAD superfamily hydrolase (TIGR01509 family)